MENQNIQWENWNEQPSENNTQPQQENVPTWGEQPQQGQPQGSNEQQQGWGEQPQQAQQPILNWEEPQQLPLQVDKENNSSWDWKEENMEPTQSSPEDFQDLDQDNWKRNHSFLGLLPKLKIESLVYKFDYDNKNILNEITNSGFEPLDKDNKFKIKYKEGTELSNVLKSIKYIGDERNLSLQHSFLYKNAPNESIINIARGECVYNYIYFIQASHNSGQVVLDLSSLNGPAEQVLEASTGILVLLPGWVPYRISKNESSQDMVAIAGRFSIPN